MNHTTTDSTVARRLATRYRRLDDAMQAVYNDVLTHCDAIREQTEQRLGTTDEDTIVDDPTYHEALELFGLVFELKTRIQHDLRSLWMGDER
ncbi:hypothetical protein EV643_16110 [Kribbella sp. VKM Ac-2527]|uniref:Uncharacterized protein n=1 Tax=Kribbella caucasensis TaxID=2512215 RepID=A0A4R6IY59_9ACTN|nr:hypothetical protein [Kribbella sp. VKM Ac-2527]TDO27367.1 hypothetical protein EV643_16110 [Kribbella sp. VKM Ac-2527]